MKKNILFRAALLLTALSATLPTMAEKISLSQARTIANRFAGATLSSGRASGQKATTALSLAYKSGSEELYAFNVGQGSGFVLVAGDDLVKNPVLGYCDNGSFNYDQLEGPAKDWVEQYAQTIAYARANNIVVESSSALASESNKEVGPLLSTFWMGFPYYNSLCPTVAGNQTVAGCCAVAMAQIMKYHNYPEHGIGSLGYLDSTEYKGQMYYTNVFADFEHTTYDWANMPESLNESSTQAQIDAVATLMNHCGVASKSKYGVNSTSSSGRNCNIGLIDYFGYDKRLQFEVMDYFTLEEWTDSLKADLNAGLPILYVGTSKMQGSHSFVIDGYQDNGYFHVNWGWGGLFNGFFSLLKMGLGTLDDDFNDDQFALLHIMPDQGGEAKCLLLETELFSMCETLDLNKNENKASIISMCGHTNLDTMNVTIYLILENKVTGETQELESAQLKIEPCVLSGFDYEDSCDFTGVKNGDYELYLTYETDNVSKRKARSINTKQGYLDVTVKDGIVTFGENEETGIHKVLNTPNAAAKGDGSIFNLSGQKVAADWETLSPGIYLKDGEKIMKK